MALLLLNAADFLVHLVCWEEGRAATSLLRMHDRQRSPSLSTLSDPSTKRERVAFKMGSDRGCRRGMLADKLTSAPLAEDQITTRVSTSPCS